MPIKILIADDHSLIRSGLRTLLEGAPDLAIVGEAEDGLTLLSRVAELEPDIVLLDISMPGLSGAEAMCRVREISPATRILALTVHEDEGIVRNMIRAGAHGYVIKRASDAELLQAIRAVSQGYIYVHPALTGALLQDISPHSHPTKPIHESLTSREMDVLLLLAQGYTNRQIAQEMHLSPRTVEGHRSSLVSKLGMKSRVELMNYVEEHGLGEHRTR